MQISPWPGREKSARQGWNGRSLTSPLLMTSKWGCTARESISRHSPFHWMHLLKTQSTTYNTGINAQTHTSAAHTLCDNHLALMRAPRRNYTVAQIRRASRCGRAPHLFWSHIKNKMSCVWIALWFDCHRPQTLIHYCFLISNVPEFKKLIMIFVYLFSSTSLGIFWQTKLQSS